MREDRCLRCVVCLSEGLFEQWSLTQKFGCFLFALSECVSSVWLAQKQAPRLWALQFLSPRVQKYTRAGARARGGIMETEISRKRKELSRREKEMRDKESGGQFHLISEFPLTFACMHVIREGILWLNGWSEPSWLKLDKPFFTVCWFFISSPCEDRGGCCTATSQNSWRGACTFCSIWKPINHLELPPLSGQTAYFLETSERVISLSLPFDFHCLRDGAQSQVG